MSKFFDLVGHRVRTRLDEYKRKEVQRLNKLKRTLDRRARLQGAPDRQRSSGLNVYILFLKSQHSFINLNIQFQNLLYAVILVIAEIVILYCSSASCFYYSGIGWMMATLTTMTQTLGRRT